MYGWLRSHSPVLSNAPQEGSAALLRLRSVLAALPVFESIVAGKPKQSPVRGVPEMASGKSPDRSSAGDVKEENLQRWNGSSRVTSFLRDVCLKPSCT